MALPNYILKLNLITAFFTLTLLLFACGGNESGGMSNSVASVDESSQSTNSTAEQSNNNNSRGAQEEVSIEINVSQSKHHIGSLNELAPADLSITELTRRAPVDVDSLNISKTPAGSITSIKVIPGQSAIQMGDSLIVAPPRDLRLFANTLGQGLFGPLQSLQVDSQRFFGTFSVSGAPNKGRIKMALPWTTETAKLEIHTFEYGNNNGYHPHKEVITTDKPSSTLDVPYYFIDNIKTRFDIQVDASAPRAVSEDSEYRSFKGLPMQFARLVRNRLDDMSLESGVVFSVAENPLANAAAGHGFEYIQPLRPENWDMIVAEVLVQKPHLHQQHEQKLITVFFPISARDRIDILAFDSYVKQLGVSHEVQSFSFVDVYHAEGYAEALERWFHVVRAQYVQVGYRSSDLSE